MFFLLRMKLNAGQRVRCVATHVRSQEAGDSGAESQVQEVLEDGEIAPFAAAGERERGWVVPVNPQPGDQIRFEMLEVEPVGEHGAAYEWEVSLCEANGPAKIESPGVFRVEVPAQTVDDIADCPGAEVKTLRAVKDGPRRFCWTIEKAA